MNDFKICEALAIASITSDTALRGTSDGHISKATFSLFTSISIHKQTVNTWTFPSKSFSECSGQKNDTFWVKVP